MKTMLLFFLFTSNLNSDDVFDNKIKNGIQLFKENKNQAAKIIFLNLNQKDTIGITDYYLGNISLNLKENEKAIKYYTAAFSKKFRINDTLFNLACAYSLNNNSFLAYKVLLLNYYRGDKNENRIRNDIDLLNFRNSIFFYYYEMFLKNKDGYLISSVQELKQFLAENNNKFILYEDNSPSPGILHFDTNGNFIEYSGGGFTGYATGGIWNLNENNEELTIEKIGSIAEKNTPIFQRTPDRQRFNSKFKYIDYYQNKIIEKINIKDIKVNILRIPEDLDSTNFVYDIQIISVIGKYEVRLFSY